MRKALYILGQLSDRDIEWMLQFGHRQVVPSGGTLIRQGEPIDHLWVILAGRLSVEYASVTHEVARIGRGEIVGEMSFIDASPPSATVTALEECVVLALPRASLDAKLDEDPLFAARFFRALAILLSDRLRAATGGRDTDLDEDELDANVLDNVHLASVRFERILQRLLEV